MDKPADAPAPLSASATREERLAARLRDNLRRRKAQARAMAVETPEESGTNAALSKSPPKS